MKNILTCLAAITSLTLVVTNATQSQAQPMGSEGVKYGVGADVTFQDSTGFGLNGKIGVSDNFSIRPKIVFGIDKKRDNLPVVGSLAISGTEYGAALTYDYKLDTGDKTTSPTLFIGPEISFWNGKRDLTVAGAPVNVDANVTIFSAVAGIEYPVTDSLDIMGRLTLPLSTSGKANVNVAAPAPIGGTTTVEGDAVKTLGVSIGVAYRF